MRRRKGRERGTRGRKKKNYLQYKEQSISTELKEMTYLNHVLILGYNYAL